MKRALSYWNRSKIILLALVLCLITCGCLVKKDRFSLLREQYNRSTAVMVMCTNGAVHYGSGVIVGKDTVLTAAHVATCPGGVVLLVTNDGKEGIGVVVRSNRDRDIAVIEAPGFSSSVVIGKRPKAGDIVCASPAIPNKTHACGEVFYEHGDTLSTWIRFSAVVQFGNSGSAVYNEDGELVGILTILTSCVNGQFCGAGASPLDIKDLE